MQEENQQHRLRIVILESIYLRERIQEKIHNVRLSLHQHKH